MGKVASFWPEGQNIVRTNCAVDKGKGRTGHGICSVGQPERFEIAMADEGANGSALSLLQRRHSGGGVAVGQQRLQKARGRGMAKKESESQRSYNLQMISNSALSSSACSGNRTC